MICTGKGDKTMHLFDTFEGIPKGNQEYGEQFKENLYACSLETVQANLSGFTNVRFHKGLFPDSIRGDREIEIRLSASSISMLISIKVRSNV